MFKYFLKRVLEMIPTLLVISIVSFSFVHLMPGDPAQAIAGPDASVRDIENIRRIYGLDKPLLVQYFKYLKGIARLDFGISVNSNLPVFEEIKGRYFYTFSLALLSFIWSITVGILVGLFAGVNKGKWQDSVVMFFTISGVSIPSFWLGLLFMDFFSVKLGILPTVGSGSEIKDYILPSLTLGSAIAAILSRFTMSSYLETLQEEYMNTAKAKGLKSSVILWKHAFRNALIPIVTMSGLQFGFLLSGSVIVETVFSWPGLGKYMIDSISTRDYSVIQTLILLFSLHFLVINLIVDLVYGFLNPSIKYGEK